MLLAKFVAIKLGLQRLVISHVIGIKTRISASDVNLSLNILFGMQFNNKSTFIWKPHHLIVDALFFRKIATVNTFDSKL